MHKCFGNYNVNVNVKCIVALANAKDNFKDDGRIRQWQSKTMAKKAMANIGII